ncbi:hypothetical protein BDF14DRAFT_1767163 [Spinellus fusiger]|nr:hypothetical protein BDF14DRAFT_1767163 [Spinellus fusiger]
MDIDWDRSTFDKDIKSLLETKLPVSASRITALQASALAHPQHSNYIIQCIIRFIESAPPDYRLAGLYVIDAISRAIHRQSRKKSDSIESSMTDLDSYLKRFATVMKNGALSGCYSQCSIKDKQNKTNKQNKQLGSSGTMTLCYSVFSFCTCS